MSYINLYFYFYFFIRHIDYLYDLKRDVIGIMRLNNV